MAALMRQAGGFSLTELLVAAALTLLLAQSILGLAGPARGVFQAQPEIADMHQRVRAAADAIGRDLLSAGAGLDVLAVPPVAPYRVGTRSSDPPSGVYYRPDTITIRYAPWTGTGVVSHTYQLRRDAASSRTYLVHYDGGSGEFAMVDHVTALAFQYYGADGSSVDPSALVDGPWLGTADEPFDADLLRARRVSVSLTVEAAQAFMRGTAGRFFARAGTSTSSERWAPDQAVAFDVTLRNAGTDR